MYNFKTLAEKAEVSFKSNPTYKNMWTLLIRYLYIFIVFKDKKYLNEAYIISVTEFNKNNKDIILLIYITFLDLIMGNIDRADENIEALSKFKKYYKNNEQKIYSLYSCIIIIRNIKLNKKFMATREFKNIERYNNEKNNPFINIIIAFLSSQLYDDTPETRQCYVTAFNTNKNKNSVLLFIAFYEYTKKIQDIGLFDDIIPNYIKWCTAHEIYIENFIDKFQENILYVINNNIKLCCDLYDIYKKNWLLKAICLKFIKSEDYSLNAYYFYKESINKQIQLKELNDFLVKSAYINNIEQKNIYPIKLYIQSHGIDTEMKPFMYHVILNNKGFKDIIEKYKFDIIQFGFYALENNLIGRYYYSIYNFILENGEYINIEQHLIQKAEDVLHKKLFSYEIEVQNKAAYYIWIKEKEKSKMQLYKLTDGKTEIKAVSDRFYYYLLDKENKNIIDSDIKITKLIENADARLYIRYYLKNNFDNNIIIALAKYYSNIEYPVYKCLNILKAALDNIYISRSFRMRIMYSIGDIYYNNSEYKKAAQYYRNIDESYLSDKKIENMLNALLDTDEIKKAVDILLKKAYCVSERTMFYIVKKAIKDKQYHCLIANFAYELLLKSWYDRSFIDVVIENYKGSQQEWIMLSKALKQTSASEKRLDELILKNAIWLNRLDKEVEEVFIDIFKNDSSNKLIPEFVEYLCYEIMINSAVIGIDTLYILEKIANNMNSDILLYSLGYVYINQKIKTDNYEKIVKRIITHLEKSDFILPIFKKCQDNLFDVPYIRKNTSFVYKSPPGKNIVLYYRFDEKSSFLSKKMNYFKFGLYLATIPVFYDESVEFYISEVMDNGSIETKKKIEYNQDMVIFENTNDEFFEINNAIIYEKMFKYEKVEKIIVNKLAKNKKVRCKLL